MRAVPTIAMVWVLGAALPVAADPAPPVAMVVTPNASFLPGTVSRYGAPVTVARGGTLVHLNADAVGLIASSWATHSIESDDAGPDGTALFSSPSIGFGGAAVVDGVERLVPGSYRFHCPVHGDEMNGLLVVEPAAP